MTEAPEAAPVTAVIEAVDLTKRYGKKVGCEDVCLSVGPGQVFGFLGPNGAGKSTFVKMMMGLIAPSSGRAEVLGRPVSDVAVRARIGFLPENFKYQEWLTPNELLAYHGKLLGLEARVVAERSEAVLQRVGLGAEGHNKIGKFSKGMQQRLGLASALLGEPELLFLDEPTSALDPVGRRLVREILLELKGRGTAVFLNSHLLSEVEMVCDQVAFIDSGRIVESGSLSELLSDRSEVEVTFAEPFAFLPSLFADGSASVSEAEPLRLVLRPRDESVVPDVVTRLVEAGARVTGVSRRRRSLESLFMETVGEDHVA